MTAVEDQVEVPRVSPGTSVLVVEDDYRLAKSICRFLTLIGATVRGPFPREAQVVDEVGCAPPDFALVDINLGHGPSFVIARLLTEMGIPFAFLTGYDDIVIPDEFREIEL